MRNQSLKRKLTISLLVCFVYQMAIGQSYKRDSLQIKGYTEIEYKNGQAKAITLKKLFCEYCSPFQLEVLGEEALRRAHGEKNNPRHVIKKGKKKIAIYIRIAKTDFAAIKEEDKPLVKTTR